MRLDDVLGTTGYPIGAYDPDGTVTVRWNSQGWSLPAPPAADGSPRKYLPCECCGQVFGVECRIVSYRCDDCEEDRCVMCLHQITRGNPADRCDCCPETVGDGAGRMLR